DLAEGWRELSLLHAARGDALACDSAYARFEALAPESARLEEAVAALAEQRYDSAEELLRQALARTPHDPLALRLLAKVARARENYPEAERLLRQCLQFAPGYSRARLDLLGVLHEQQKGEPMLPLVERLLARDPGNEDYRTVQAIAWTLLGETGRALTVLETLTREFPQSEVVWLNYGHTLRTAGRGAEAIAAYRRCSALKPGFGSAWMALANLKTFRFTPQDVEAMRRELAREQLPEEERSQFEFALAKALEDAGEYRDSFAHYARANSLRRAVVNYRGEVLTHFVERTRTLYTREFFAAHAGCGSPAPDPIFVVGLPRAGSTLVEQILASHSQVEGTRELTDVTQIAVELGDRDEESSAYPQSVAALTHGQLTALGERYLAQTRAHRLLGRARFVDKMGSNFLHLGLIHLMLPNARIIDVRRAPLACCFANFKQHFHRGAWFTYSLEDLGRYYRDYLTLMAHFDAVLPGRVYRLSYEALVGDLEGEVRGLLGHCGLPFEEQCLRFHETERSVQTVSSEQVRRPLYTEALGELAPPPQGAAHGA
ncbi:MAG TPA: sulfotransferase, partial [Steroidobacteraceae bacterium]|nr:sulfotransferase [Steroidobacteraceae bacterium]